MIVICENCQARYLVPTYELKPDGRTVRCSQCGHEWRQSLEEDGGGAGGDETIMPPPEDLEPIPESVKPLPEDSGLPVIPGHEEKTGGVSSEAIVSAGIAVFIGGVLFLFLLLMHQPVMRSWPESASFYNLLGMTASLKGEGVIFDRAKAHVRTSRRGGKELYIEGTILNLGQTSVELPKLKASFRSTERTVGEPWLIDMEAHEIEGGVFMSFETVVSTIPEGASEVALQFILGEEF